MARIIGIGGVFYKTDDPKQTAKFYQDVLGLPVGEGFDGSMLAWRRADQPEEVEQTVFSMFPADTKYLDPSQKDVMVNFITDDLDGMLSQLRDAGVDIVGDTVEEPYGKFAWFMDPSGAKMELWEPIKGVL